MVITRAMKLNDSMIEGADTLEREAQLAAVEQAIRGNQDLHQHALRMMDAVGREVVLQRLGLSNSDIYTVSRMSQEVLENQAKLQGELQIYGPNNRRVQETQQRIAIAEQYLQGRRQAERDQLLTLSRNELGPMLLDVARQQLQEAIAHESAIQASYEQEKMQAISLDGTMAQLEIIELDLTRLRGFYDIVLERLKDIDMGREGGMLRTAILSRPQVPNGPVWPRLRTVAMLSVFLGLCVGFESCTSATCSTTTSVRPRNYEPSLGFRYWRSSASSGRWMPRRESVQFMPTSTDGSRNRTLPHAADGVGFCRRRRKPHRDFQQRAGRRQDDRGGQSCGGLFPIGQADAAGRCRHATTGPDRLVGHAGTAGAVDCAARAGAGRGGGCGDSTGAGAAQPRCTSVGAAASQSYRAVGERTILRVSRLGRGELRPDPHRQPAGTGERHGDHRPAGGWSADGGPTREEPPQGRDAGGREFSRLRHSRAGRGG